MPAPAAAPRLLVTRDLSRLARWLRLLGFDTVIAQSEKHQDWARACALQKRILLTRIKTPGKLTGITNKIIIGPEMLADQLRLVVKELDLHEFNVFSRCLGCNRRVYSISKDRIIERLPEKVRNREQHFTYCRKCGKIFWKGTHFEAMLQFLSRELDGMAGKNIREFVLTDFC